MQKELPKAWFKKSKKWPSYRKERAAYTDQLPCAKNIQDVLKKSPNWDMKRYNHELTKILKSLPNDPFIITWQAAIYGDYGQCLGEKKERQFRTSASRRIRPLLKQLRSKPAFLQTLVRNEFFYHSYSYLKQYQLGIKTLQSGHNGHFSAGVGSAMHALHLAKEGKRTKAIEYGKKSLRHWLTYSNPTEYGQIFYCLALAFNGQPEKAIEEFQKVLRKDKFHKTSHRKYYQSRTKDLEFVINFMKKE